MISLESVPPVPEKVKPKYRGTFHSFGFVAALFGFFELALAPVEGFRYWAGLVYGASLIAMLGLSALYHRPMWSHAARHRLRAVDHLGVFLLIAGSYTPLAALQSPHAPTYGLIGMWVGSIAGMIHALINLYGDRRIRAVVYVVLGLCAAPLIWNLQGIIGGTRALILAVGSAIYIIGAGVYARRWPNPDPKTFGYHEVFHVMVLIAAGMHYAVIWTVQQS